MKTENIQVLLRLRPEEDGKKTDCSLAVSGTQSVLLNPASDKLAKGRNHTDATQQTFTFDHVYGPEAKQEDVFVPVKPLVDSVLKGYNATIFAYGSTGSGKTYSIAGTSSAPGIVPNAIQHLFSLANTITNDNPDAMILVHMAYVELYNNTFRDLLEHTKPAKPLVFSGKNVNNRDPQKIEIHTDKSGQVYLSGSQSLRTPVTSAAQALSLYAQGTKYRATSTTNCNQHSSRSHSILTFYVECRESVKMQSETPNPKGKHSVVRMGKLHLIDLAGSERVAISGAEGEELLEAQNINLSLSTLGDVLSALSKVGARAAKKKVKHSSHAIIPYRNSKLTYLLKDSLGGNSKTIMLATVRLPVLYRQQTLITLMYASRAKKIQNHTKINTDVIGTSEASKLVAQIEKLKQQLKHREVEFERLSHLKVQEQDSNAGHDLMVQLANLSKENEVEKSRLQSYLQQVVHNHKSTMAVEQEKYSELQERLGVYRDAYHEQQEELKLLRKSVKQFSGAGNIFANDNVSELHNMVRKLTTALENSRREVATLTEEREHLASQKQTLRDQLSEVEEHNDKLLKQLESKIAVAKQVDNITVELEDVKRTNRVLQNKCDSLEEKLRRAQDGSNTMVAHTEAVLRQEELNRVANTRAKWTESHIHALEVQSSELSTQLAKMRKEKNGLENVMKEEQLKAQILNDKLSKEVKVHEHQLQRVLKSNEERLKVYEKQQEATQLLLSKREQALSQLNEKLSMEVQEHEMEMKRVIKVHEEKLKVFEQKLEDKQLLLSKSEELGRQLRDERDCMDAEIESLQSKLSRVENCVESTEKELREAQTELMQKQKLFELSSEKRGSIIHEVNELKSVQNEYCTKLRQENKALHQSLSELKQKHAEMSSNVLQLTGELKDSNAHISNLENKIIALNEKHQSSLQDAKQHSLLSRTKLENQLNEAIQGRTKLSQDVDQLSKKLTDRDAKIQDLKSQLKRSKTVVENASSTIRGNHENLKSMDEQLKSTMEKLRDANERYELQKAKCEEHLNEKMTLQMQFESTQLSYQHELQELESSVQKLQEDIKSRDAKLHELHSKHDLLGAEMQSQQEKLFETEERLRLDRENAFAQNEELERVKSERDKLSSIVQDRDSRLQSLESDVVVERESSKRLQVTCSKLENEVAQLLKQQALATEARDVATASLLKMGHELDNEKTIAKQHELDLEQLRRKHETEIEQHRETKATLEQCSKELEVLRTSEQMERDQLRETKITLEQNAKDLEDLRASTEMEKSNTQVKLHQLLQSESMLQSKLDTIENENSTLKASLEILKEGSKSMEESLQRLKQYKVEAEEKEVDLNDRVDYLLRQTEEIQVAKASLEREYAALQEDTFHMKNTLDLIQNESTQKLKQVNEELNRSKTKHQSQTVMLRKQLELEQSTIKLLGSKLAEAEGKCEQTLFSIGTADVQVLKQKKLLETLVDEAKSLILGIGDIERDLAGVSGQRVALVTALETANENCRVLKLRVESADAQSMMLTGMVEEMQTKNSSLAIALEAEKTEHQKTVEALKASQETHSRVLLRTEELEKALGFSKERNDHSTEELYSVHKQMAALKLNVVEAFTQYEDEKRKVRYLEEKNRNLLCHTRTSNERLHELISFVEVFTERIRILESSLERLHNIASQNEITTIADLREQNTHLSQENDEMRVELHAAEEQQKLFSAQLCSQMLDFREMFEAIESVDALVDRVAQNNLDIVIDRDQTVKKLNATLLGLKRENDKSKVRHIRQVLENRELATRNDELATLLGKERKEVQQYQEEVTQLTHELDRTKFALERAQSSLNESREQLQAMNEGMQTQSTHFTEQVNCIQLLIQDSFGLAQKCHRSVLESNLKHQKQEEVLERTTAELSLVNEALNEKLDQQEKSIRPFLTWLRSLINNCHTDIQIEEKQDGRGVDELMLLQQAISDILQNYSVMKEKCEKEKETVDKLYHVIADVENCHRELESGWLSGAIEQGLRKVQPELNAAFHRIRECEQQLRVVELFVEETLQGRPLTSEYNAAFSRAKELPPLLRVGLQRFRQLEMENRELIRNGQDSLNQKEKELRVVKQELAIRTNELLASREEVERKWKDIERVTSKNVELESSLVQLKERLALEKQFHDKQGSVAEHMEAAVERTHRSLAAVIRQEFNSADEGELKLSSLQKMFLEKLENLQGKNNQKIQNQIIDEFQHTSGEFMSKLSFLETRIGKQTKKLSKMEANLKLLHGNCLKASSPGKKSIIDAATSEANLIQKSLDELYSKFENLDHHEAYNRKFASRESTVSNKENMSVSNMDILLPLAARGFETLDISDLSSSLSSGTLASNDAILDPTIAKEMDETRMILDNANRIVSQLEDSVLKAKMSLKN